MKPIDYRNDTWDRLRALVTSNRARVYDAWLALRELGPSTTVEASTHSGISLLSFRPRTTELLQLGLIELTGGRNGEGLYLALDPQEAERRFARLANAARADEQMFLKMTT